MELNDIVTTAVNAGMSVVVVAFFMYRDLKFMGELKQTLQSLVDTVSLLKEIVLREKD